MLSGSRNNLQSNNNLQIINTSNVLKGNISPSLPSPSALPQNTGFRVKYYTGRGSVSSVTNPGGGKIRSLKKFFNPSAPVTTDTIGLVPRPMFTAKRTNSPKVLQKLNNPKRFGPFNPNLEKERNVYPGWEAKKGGRSRRRTRHTHRKRRSLRRQSHRQRSRRVQRR